MSRDKLLEVVIEALSVRLTDMEAKRSLCDENSWLWQGAHEKCIELQEALDHYIALR